ncbi:MAG: hypothetical protein M1818_000789 [Claussenomyces sp. TS43310]|nr:MAG: hypothetical protein M1818_000789 [Claussenomyces sp. TS43310]
MATYQINNYYRPSSLTVDTNSQKFFEEDDASILDDNILDQGALDSGLEMSPHMDGSRRESYAVSSAIFSPKTEDWHHVDMQHSTSNNPFVDHSNNPYLNTPLQSSTFGQQSQWSMGNGSGTPPPLQAFDGLPAEFDGNASVTYGAIHTQTPFSNTGNQVSLFSPSVTSNGSMPTSPQKEWLPSENIEHRGMPKRMRPSSPPLRSHSPLLRRDGIRKKNARFDIPAERNLNNIDHLIHTSTDEQEIKELKQQKRLLRNRQAALDSRQRKKQHTERLEDEKKHYTALLNELEEELAEAKINMDDWNREKQQYQQYIETLQLEKEEMLRAHTIETGDLRKKVSVLTEHVQKLESTAMSAAAPRSTGFSTDYVDIDSLTMDGAWDSISFLNDFSTENDEIKHETALVPAKKVDTTFVSDQDKPAAQGLLLMILLLGAFAASRGSSASIPRVSDDVRAASATLLEDIYKDAGLAQSKNLPSVLENAAPMPSGDAWSATTTSNHLGMNDMTSRYSSSLGGYADSLTQPTEAQKHEQLFSLTAAQYNGVASPDYLRNAPPSQSTSQGRRNLAETLAAMRGNSKHSAAEVYTRSLLWDQVPSDVVRSFAKLVDEHNDGKDPTQDG